MEELFCDECSKSNCNHIYRLRLDLFEEFRKYFDKTQLFYYLSSLLNREYFTKKSTFINFNEFKDLSREFLLNPDFLYSNNDLKAFVQTHLLNFLIKEIMNGNSSFGVNLKDHFQMIMNSKGKFVISNK